MTNQELASRLRAAAGSEREITAEVIRLVATALKQELWKESEHADIYAWLIKECRYSQGAAHRRIQAAKLSLASPELSEKVAEGELTLTALAQAQTAVRQEERRTGQTVDRDTKRALVSELVGKSESEAQQAIARQFPEVRAKPQERFEATAEGWKLTAHFTQEQKRRLERLREVTGHSHPNAGWGELIAAAVEEMLKRADPIERHARRARRRDEAQARSHARRQAEAQRQDGVRAGAGQAKGGAVVRGGAVDPAGAVAEASGSGDLHLNESTSMTRSYLAAETPSVEREPTLRIKADEAIAKAGAQCEHRDARTGRRCESRVRIQIDHVYPRALGGEDEATNLRCLCALHNRIAAADTLGISMSEVRRRKGACGQEAGL